MATYLYKIRPFNLEILKGNATQEEQKIIGEHFEYLKDLTEQGIVLLAGRTLNEDETSFGIVIFSAETEEEATIVMNSDPAVRKKVFQAKLFPYGISLVNKNIIG